ncbi:hypothetical protein BKA62DRAFT_766799 [Auriculariales sp. MPI-PUGE-AT-0066]|nr:hypothetical protein BKA62DRAFT_766799 [Auriculariales sp. MPI-PUGE-AT-0066]
MCIQHYCRYSCGCELNTEFAQCNAGRRISQQPYVLVRSDNSASPTASQKSSPTDRKPPVSFPMQPPHHSHSHAHSHGRSLSLGAARCAPVREGTASASPCPSHSSPASHLFNFTFPGRSHEDYTQHSD